MKIITAKKVSQLLGIHETTVRRLVKLSKIPHVWIGDSLRFDLDMISEWITKQSTTSYTQVAHYQEPIGRSAPRKHKRLVSSKQLENTFSLRH